MRDYFMETQRMGFSIWTNRDMPLANALWGEPAVTRFISANGVFTEKDIQHRLLMEIEMYQKHEVQYFPLFDLSTSHLIGCCGLRPDSQEKNSYELGVHIRASYWKQGLAREAAQKMIDYSFSAVNASQLIAGHHPNNTASQKLLLKLGFSYAEDRFYEPTGLYHPTYRLTCC